MNTPTPEKSLTLRTITQRNWPYISARQNGTTRTLSARRSDTTAENSSASTWTNSERPQPKSNPRWKDTSQPTSQISQKTWKTQNGGQSSKKPTTSPTCWQPNTTWQILDASGNFKVAVGDLKSSQYPWKTQEYMNMKLDDIVETPAFLEAFRKETTDMLPGEQARILEQISEKLTNDMNESTGYNSKRPWDQRRNHSRTNPTVQPGYTRAKERDFQFEMITPNRRGSAVKAQTQQGRDPFYPEPPGVPQTRSPGATPAIRIPRKIGDLP